MNRAQYIQVLELALNNEGLRRSLKTYDASLPQPIEATLGRLHPDFYTLVREEAQKWMLYDTIQKQKELLAQETPAPSIKPTVETSIEVETAQEITEEEFYTEYSSEPVTWQESWKEGRNVSEKIANVYYSIPFGVRTVGLVASLLTITTIVGITAFTLTRAIVSPTPIPEQSEKVVSVEEAKAKPKAKVKTKRVLRKLAEKPAKKTRNLGEE